MIQTWSPSIVPPQRAGIPTAKPLATEGSKQRHTLRIHKFHVAGVPKSSRFLTCATGTLSSPCARSYQFYETKICHHDMRLGWGAAADWMFGRRRQGFLQANRRNTIMRLRCSAAPDRKSGRPARHSYKPAAATPAISIEDKAELIEAGLALLPFENSQMDVPEGQIFIELPKGVKARTDPACAGRDQRVQGRIHPGGGIAARSTSGLINR